MNNDLIDLHIVTELIALGKQVNKNLLNDLISKYEADVKKRLVLIESSLHTQNDEVLHHQIHQLKGSSSALGLKQLAAFLKLHKSTSTSDFDKENLIQKLQSLVDSSVIALKKVSTQLA